MTPASSGRTPGPYSVGALQNGTHTVRAHGITLAQLTMGTGRAARDAAFIVQACNSHEALVGALRKCEALLNLSDMRHYVSAELGEQAQLHAALNSAQAALALAAGGGA